MNFREKIIFAIQAVANIQSLIKLSLETGVKLHLKTVPVSMYDLEMP
jgi:hypothetical protein